MTAVHRGVAGRRSQYDNERHSAAKQGDSYGDVTIRRDLVDVKVVSPTNKDGSLIFRPFPPLDSANLRKALLPGRKSPNPFGFTEWFVDTAGAAYVGIGDTKFSWVLYNPFDPDSIKSANPYVVFSRRCLIAYDKGDDNWQGSWNSLCKGSQGKGAPLSWPVCFTFFQGAVYRNAKALWVGKPPLGFGAEDPLSIIRVKSSRSKKSDRAGLSIKLQKLLDTPRPEPAQGGGFSAGYRYGDPVGRFDPKTNTVKGGLFIEIFYPTVTQRTQHTTWNGSLPENFNPSYEAALHASLTDAVMPLRGAKVSSDLDAAATARILEKSQFWWDDPDDPSDKGLIYVPPVEEQLVMIARGFSSVPGLYEFGFDAYPEYLDCPEVQSILRSRKTFAGGVVVGEGANGSSRAPRRQKDPTQQAARSEEIPSWPGEEPEEEGETRSAHSAEMEEHLWGGEADDKTPSDVEFDDEELQTLDDEEASEDEEEAVEEEEPAVDEFDEEREILEEEEVEDMAPSPRAQVRTQIRTEERAQPRTTKPKAQSADDALDALAKGGDAKRASMKASLQKARGSSSGKTVAKPAQASGKRVPAQQAAKKPATKKR